MKRQKPLHSGNGKFNLLLLTLALISTNAVWACDPFQYFDAPDTKTDSTIVGCWITTVFAAPVDTKIDDTQDAGAVGIVNDDITGCPEPGKPPKQTKEIERKEYKCKKYSLGASAQWEVFGLTASADSEESSTFSTKTTLELTSWCQRLQWDMAKRHMRQTVAWSQTRDSHWYCGGCAGSGTLSLDRYYYIERSGDDVVPEVVHKPASNCKSTCN